MCQVNNCYWEILAHFHAERVKVKNFDEFLIDVVLHVIQLPPFFINHSVDEPQRVDYTREKVRRRVMKVNEPNLNRSNRPKSLSVAALTITRLQNHYMLDVTLALD